MASTRSRPASEKTSGLIYAQFHCSKTNHLVEKSAFRLLVDHFRELSRLMSAPHLERTLCRRQTTMPGRTSSYTVFSIRDYPHFPIRSLLPLAPKEGNNLFQNRPNHSSPGIHSCLGVKKADGNYSAYNWK